MMNGFRSFVLCCVIAVCAYSSARAEQVEVISVSGTVEVLLEGADDYTSAEEGMILESGDKITTSSGASAELSFNEANTNVVRLSENTDSTITLSDDEKMDVSAGEVFASVSDLPSGSAFEIRTPTAVSGARGTDWVTKVTDDGTDVEAVDSVPYVKHFETGGVKSRQMTMIQPGQMTTVRKFQPPMQPRPMNVARKQQWQGMKQQVRQRAGEAIVKRQQRPEFNRKDFIQQMKGRKEQKDMKDLKDQQQDGFKPLKSEDRPKKSFEQQGDSKPLRSEDRPKQSFDQKGEFKPLVSGEKKEQMKQEQMKQEQMKQPQMKQPQMKQEQMKQPQMKQEQMKQEQMKQQQMKQPQMQQQQMKQQGKPPAPKNPKGAPPRGAGPGNKK